MSKQSNKPSSGAHQDGARQDQRGTSDPTPPSSSSLFSNPLLSQQTLTSQLPPNPPPNSSHLPLHLKWSQPKIVRDENNPYVDPGIDFSNDPGLTDQSQAAECDVNYILKRYQQTGILPNTDVKSVFADVSSVPDYQDALNIVINAENQFSVLDAQMRARFMNDPANFLAFVEDPKNAPELIKMGLATAPQPSAVDRMVDALKASKADGVPVPTPKS